MRTYNVPVWYDHRNKCYKRGQKIVKGPYKAPRTNDEKLDRFILEERFQNALNDNTEPNHELARLVEMARCSFTHQNPLKEVRELKMK